MRNVTGTTVLSIVFGLTLLGTACSDDDSGNNNGNGNGVHLSDVDLAADNLPADYSCLDATDPAQVFSTDTEVTGAVLDFEESTPVPGIVVSIYATRQDLLDDLPFDTSEPSDANGSYTITVPAGRARVHWKSVDPLGQDEHFDTIEMGDPIAGFPPNAPPTTGADRQIISAATVQSVPVTLGIARIEGRGVIAGTLYDCNRRHVEHAAVRVYDGPPSDTTRNLLSVYEGDGLNTFYFYAGMPSRLQQYTDPEGQFLSANLYPGGSVWVEMWGRMVDRQTPDGFADCTEGCRVSVEEIPVIGDTIVIADLNPLYATE